MLPVRSRQRPHCALALALAALGLPRPAAAATYVVGWGDSITYGYFDGTSSGNDCTNGEPDNDPPEDCGYPGRLDSRLNDALLFSPVYDIEVLNLGKGGEKTTQALSRMDRSSWTCPCSGLATPCPINSLKYWVCNGTLQPDDLLVLMEGTNDITEQNLGLETIAANLEALGQEAEALGLDIVISTLTPRHPDAWTKIDECDNDGDGDVVALNDLIADLATAHGWPKVDPYTRLKALSGLFNNYYQDWVVMKCDDPLPVCTQVECDPVGHPNRSGFNKMTYDSNTHYSKTFESVVRSALPPRLTLTAPTPPLQSGVALQFSVTLHDLVEFDQTVELTWDFGDGTVVVESVASSPAAKSHTYWTAGDFTVTVPAAHATGGARSTSALADVALGTAVFVDGFESGGTSAWIVGG